MALTGRGKVVALRGFVSVCVVEEAPLPQGEESADAGELQQWDNCFIQGEMRRPNLLTLPFPPLALVVQLALVVLHVPVESRQHVRRQERAVALKVLPGSLPDLPSPGWCMPNFGGTCGSQGHRRTTWR